MSSVENPAPLLPRVAAGEREAVKACIERYGGLVWSLARRLLGDPGQLDDAVQEIFIELWRHAGRYDPTVASEPVFVSMLARRRLIDRRRRLDREPAMQELDSPGTLELSGESGAERCVEAAEATAALRGLSVEQRTVLEMGILRGHSQQEIATITGLPLGTVKTHMRRGMMAIRRRLDSEPAAPVGDAGGLMP